MNDLLFMISMPLGFMLPVIALAISMLIGIFLPSLYLYLDKDQQFQGSVSDEGVEDEN